MQQHGFLRAATELIGVWMLATAFHVIVPFDMPVSLNVEPFGAKWIGYQAAESLYLLILPPFVISLAVGAAVARLSSPQPNYWSVYRGALLVTIVWAIFVSAVLWYGHAHMG